jgi:phospholipase/carboxylesterase
VTATGAAGVPHGGMPVASTGAPLERARAAMIMVHGRGGSAEDMLSLSGELFDPAVAYLAPQAAGGTWYPHSFLTAIQGNEPGISSGIAVIGEIENQVRRAGIPAERIFLIGFSQGACLMLEYAARNARHFGGVAGLSGGLIGPEGTPREYTGSFEGTPVFLGCSALDPHIPEPRVRLTEKVFASLGAKVTMRLYPEPGHTINKDELQAVRGILRTLLED